MQRAPLRAGAVDKTISDHPLKPLYGPDDVAEIDPERDLGYPGQYPFTRGIHPTMYRGRLWTMRQFAGFGTATQTNARYKFLLSQGQTGLSVAFDMPALMGYDSDHPRALGEVGKCGVAIATLDDMHDLFRGIDLGSITTSMTINCTAPVALAMYLAAAEEQGVPAEKLGGTLQNDMLKEYIAQKEWIYPPEPSMRIITDMMAYCAKHVPKWNTISVSGYHIREAGSTAVQELAFTLADGFAYVEAGIEAGMNVDDFAPRLSFFFNAHSDFFEEIAKFRAARRIWARHMRGRYNATNPRSWALRFHTQTAGCSATAQQPENNIMRTAFQALAAVLGGTQSLHTNSLDEVLALPTEKNVQIALRTQQVIAYETGAANVIDPLGGSYFMEKLTAEMEEQAEDYFRRIDEFGGVIPAIHAGFFQREIADASYAYQREIESGERIIVGVNDFINEEEPQISLLKIDRAMEQDQVARVRAFRSGRDGAKVADALAALKRAAESEDNLMPHYLHCVKSKATLGEISEELVPVFGRYREPAFV
ncbi:MAG: methylmalonyl-CoA mutase family protein [Candidatus Eremiobacteraeota bacterium]|nr:methylmalonyl-CoA mutase family protein [Candidatus Eremiobacteraeota bacterium]MBC5827000.1 methylmalonyl-CoA mutase family protein [Candidatus Eremiobacteraeota bacterium]